MTAPKPWTDEETAELHRLHGEGVNLNQIAKQMGRGRATISKYAKIEGLSFDRSMVEKATQASRIDRKERRQHLADQLIEIQEKIAARVLAGMSGDGYWSLIGLGGGEQGMLQQPYTPALDLKNDLAALSTSATALKNLEAIDGPTENDEAISMLVKLQVDLQDAAKMFGPEGPQ